MKLHYAWLLTGLALAQSPLPSRAAAAEPTPGVPAAPLDWKELPADEQQLLQPYAKDWESLPAPRQQALERGAHRWLSMDPSQRAEARGRFQSWQKLPEERRQLIRKRWERFQQLDPQSKALVKENFQAFMRLPPEKRRMLRQRWLAATPEQRQHMLQQMRQRREHRHRPPHP